MWFAWNRGEPNAVNEIEASLPMSSVAEWFAWLSIDGPELNADRRAGEICAITANSSMNRDPKVTFKPPQFFPSLRTEEDYIAEQNQQTPEEMEAYFREFARRHNRRNEKKTTHKSGGKRK